MGSWGKRLVTLWAYGLCALIVNQTPADAARVRLLAFGDSLTAGYNLAPGQSFADQLEGALKAKGYDVAVIQAGVSGDTTTGGKARLDWVLAGAKADCAIVELGANDMLRGVDPDLTRDNLDAILARLQERNIRPFLAGMLALPNLGKSYQSRFNDIYPALAKRHNVPLYPFFLDGVATHADLTLPDGLHPNGAGVAVIVRNILPSLIAWLGPPS